MAAARQLSPLRECLPFGAARERVKKAHYITDAHPVVTDFWHCSLTA